MFSNRAFFSIMGLTDPAKHRAYNEYHQLDHRPENLLLPGVAWGDRWVRSPDCAAASTGADPAFDDCHYATMYFLREPLAENTKDWIDLGEHGHEWGRRPDLAWRKNHFQNFMRPVKGYAAPRVLVSPDAVPFRPVHGIHLTLSRFEAKDVAAHDVFAWYDRVRIPDLLACPGIAGVWTFSGENAYANQGDTSQSLTRITMLYLDEDPLSVLSDIQSKEAAWRSAGRACDASGVETILFASPFRTIVPWEWNWFDPVNTTMLFISNSGYLLVI